MNGKALLFVGLLAAAYVVLESQKKVPPRSPWGASLPGGSPASGWGPNAMGPGYLQLGSQAVYNGLDNGTGI